MRIYDVQLCSWRIGLTWSRPLREYFEMKYARGKIPLPTGEGARRAGEGYHKYSKINFLRGTPHPTLSRWERDFFLSRALNGISHEITSRRAKLLPSQEGGHQEMGRRGGSRAATRKIAHRNHNLVGQIVASNFKVKHCPATL